MDNQVLQNFMKARGLIKEEPKPSKVIKKEPILEKVQEIKDEFNIKKIIELKPSNKKVIKWLNSRMEENENNEL